MATELQPPNVRLDAEGEAMARAIFRALRRDQAFKWKDVSRFAKARYRAAAKAARDAQAGSGNLAVERP